MGIFPEIDRAWVTVDNRLYFWNYRNGSDFHTFDELDQSIIAVALVPPKPETFLKSITNLLVLCTSRELYIIAIAYDKAKNELELFETGMTNSVGGLEVSSIIASKSTGRIFLYGKTDGVNISEINYSTDDAWFRSKCSKTCPTRSFVSSYVFSFVDSFLKQSTPETIASMVIDDSRSLLYTLSNLSTIRMYYMDPKGGLTHMASYTLSQIVSHIQMIPTPSHQLSEDPNNFAITGIVAIQVIEKKESSRLNLIGITTTGSRIYIKAANTSSIVGPPTTMQAVQQRYPPVSSSSSVPKSFSTLAGSTSLSRIFPPGYYFSVVRSRTGELGNSVFASAPDSAKVISQFSAGSVGTNSIYYETACFLEIEGFVQEICMITPYSGGTQGFGNESATQYSVPNPQIVILTNTGVHIYTRKFPFQVLEELGQDIHNFVDYYGRTETCASALSIASRFSSFSSDECDFASKVFIGIGGKPQLRVVDEENTYSLSANPGTLSQLSKFNTSSVFPSILDSSSEVIRLSGRFDGLAAYVSRIIRSLWKSRVFNVKNTSGNKIFSHSTDKRQLESMHLVLMETWEYLDKNRTFIDGLSGGPDSLLATSGRSEEIALQAEHRGLHALVALIKSMNEGITFILLLIDESSKTSNGFESIASFLSVELRAKLEALTFKEFFASQSGKDIARELITCLVNRNIADGGSVESVSSVLKDKCVSYCSSDDVSIYKALECLGKAEFLEGLARQQKLTESLDSLQKAAAGIPFDTFKDVIADFVKLKFYPGAVELALTVAHEEDRGNLAMGYVNDGRDPNDPRKEKFGKRERIYDMIFEILDVADQQAQQVQQANTFTSDGQIQICNTLRDETYFVCYSSNDELFHNCFYDWFVSKDLAIRLLDIETPFILPYLRLKAEYDFKIANLLWTYYQKHGNFFGAAEVLFILAKSSFNISLSQRIEFLSRARTYCSCPCPPTIQQEVARCSTDIQEYLDVANIQDEILREVTHDDCFDEGRRESIIETLQHSLLNVSDLYNNYALPLKYYEIMLQVFQTTDHHESEVINNTWDSLILSAQTKAESSANNSLPYEYISQMVQKLGQQLMLAEFVFPADYLIPRLESYSVEFAQDAPEGWVVDTFINSGMSFEALLSIFSDLLGRRDYPFDDSTSFKTLARDGVYLLKRSLNESRTLDIQELISPELLDILESAVGIQSIKDVRARLSYQ